MNPKWECNVEMLVTDLASVGLVFAVCSLPKNPKLQDGDLLGLCSFSLASVSICKYSC